MMDWKRCLQRPLALAVLACAVMPAHAYVTFLDRFTVSNSSGIVVDDTFSDGISPPSAQGCTVTPNCYSIDGSFPAGSESGGKLRIDTSIGTLSESASGDPRQVQRARLLTPRSADPTNGLKLGNVFEVSAIYDVVVPGPADAAQIRLTDSHNNTADPGHQTDYLQLQFRRGTGAGAEPVIRLIEQNFNTGTVSTEASTPFNFSLGADQIRLVLSHPTINSTEIVASWQYLAGGLVVGSGSFTERGNIFDGESWTRADFIVSALPVPEPETYALMLLGLGLIAWRVRGRNR
jgi:hypothetical protein